MLAHKLRDLRARRAAGESGFTLVELLVVVVIVVALAAIAVPIYLGQKDKAEGAAIDGDIAAVAKLITGAVSAGENVTVSGKTLSYNSADSGEQSVTVDSGVTISGFTTGKFNAANPSAVPPVAASCIQLSANGENRKFTLAGGIATGTC